MFPPPHILRLEPLCLVGYQLTIKASTRGASSLEMSYRVQVDKVLGTGRASEKVKPQSRWAPNRAKAPLSALFLHIPVSQHAYLCPDWPAGPCSSLPPGTVNLVPSSWSPHGLSGDRGNSAHTHSHTCTNVRAHTNTCTHKRYRHACAPRMHAHTQTYIHTCMCVRARTHTQPHSCTCMHKHSASLPVSPFLGLIPLRMRV